ncbi:uncharacterized protein LOC106459380 [Limulus polyphemus]|uniref:Uncharacterized protein LOC106459380 n=1 Tax=Limulus polyphemus TaxID=6850 RepID=A0ABM1B464_LIMPO|nr:uncharacterized protein LOC106459380 [Limulus polyphemus]
MQNIITSEVIDEYQNNGAVCIRNVFDLKWVKAVEKGIQRNLENQSSFSETLRGQNESGAYFDDYCNWTWISEFRDFVFQSPVAEMTGLLMQSQYSAFYHEHVLVKEPGTTQKTPWHHDQSYYPIDGFKVCSVWMPVDSVSKDSSIQFVAGSHRWGKWFYPRKFATFRNYELENNCFDRVFEDVPDIDAGRDHYTILQWDVQSGDCVVLHMRTLQGAPGNISFTRPRRVLATRWLGDDAVVTNRDGRHHHPLLES